MPSDHPDQTEHAMQDPLLNRLATALDGLIEAPTNHLACDIDESNARLRHARELGVLAECSPYVAFVGRLLDDKRHAPLAASA
jgi:hypothetical protein